MFRRKDVHPLSNPICVNPVEELVAEDFLYYDKDGFELNKAEQKFYRAMRFPIDFPLLNHTCWQEPWFELENKTPELILDHSMFLQRCAYRSEAREQIQKFAEIEPRANLLLQTKIKWGFDFDLDAVAPDGTVYEVLHIEYDDTDYNRFSAKMMAFDYKVRHTDWVDAAQRIWNHRDQWQDLKGFAQNDWKAAFLIGWKRAEYTEKAV